MNVWHAGGDASVACEPRRPLRAAAGRLGIVLAVLLGGGCAISGEAANRPGRVGDLLDLPEAAELAGWPGDLAASATRVAAGYVRVTLIEAPDAAGRGGLSNAPLVLNGASGVVVDARGLVVTAAHIAGRRGRRAEVTTLGGATLPARVLLVDCQRELALLATPPLPGAPAPRWRSGGELTTGLAVFAIGTPGTVPGVVRHGRVRNPRRATPIEYGGYRYDDAIVLDLPAAPGFSGGPVYDANGFLIGMLASFGLDMTAAGGPLATGTAYVVPADSMRRFVAEAMSRWPAPGEPWPEPAWRGCAVPAPSASG